MVTEIGGGFIIQFWTKRRHAYHSLESDAIVPHAPLFSARFSAAEAEVVRRRVLAWEVAAVRRTLPRA